MDVIVYCIWNRPLLNTSCMEHFKKRKLSEEMRAELLFVSVGLAAALPLKSIWRDLTAIITEQSALMVLFISPLYLLFLSCFSLLSLALVLFFSSLCVFVCVFSYLDVPAVIIVLWNYFLRFWAPCRWFWKRPLISWKTFYFPQLLQSKKLSGTEKWQKEWSLSLTVGLTAESHRAQWKHHFILIL